ncbi:Pathogenesis-related thaumatin superfamily protein [Abeliophyllum distichum]|uniref:Pathogenesis-related thaumatin superfamily protein n=1 Tax=Abeliophyllum distichum TaxID=126358 RepID=A0ABD1UHB2_9LAMI
MEGQSSLPSTNTGTGAAIFQNPWIKSRSSQLWPGKVECAGASTIPHATLAEFTLNGDQSLHFYVVSLVDGYNLPMLIVAEGGTRGGCSATGCLIDLNGACPKVLSMFRLNGSWAHGVACKSACEAFGDPVYCCNEAYNTPDTCYPSAYSLYFKHACPRSYSYVYDDKTSTFTCASTDYIIIFCPLPYKGFGKL